MPEKNRANLKNLFLKGKIPKEGDFHELLDSTVNKVDDGIGIGRRGQWRGFSSATG